MPSSPLTIAIPTFDRAPFLAQTLDAFAKELRDVPPDDVDFLVIDNCSSDGTAEIVGRFTQILPGLRYVRNAENVGAERNIMSCALTSAGEFTWIFGDDDLPSPGALPTLLRNIRSHPSVDLYLLNYMQMNQSLSTVHCPQVLHETDDIALDSMKEFFGFLGSAEIINFISATAFRTSRIRRTSFEAYVGFGSYFGHFGALIEAFHARPCRYLGAPMVIQRQGNQRIDAAEGVLGLTFLSELPAFVGFLRVVDLLLEKGALVPEDLDTMTAKHSFHAIPSADCVSILDWWIDRTLVQSMAGALRGLINPTTDETYKLACAIVSKRNFGKATKRMQNILDLTGSISVAITTLTRL